MFILDENKNRLYAGEKLDYLKEDYKTLKYFSENRKKLNLKINLTDNGYLKILLDKEEGLMPRESRNRAYKWGSSLREVIKNGLEETKKQILKENEKNHWFEKNVEKAEQRSDVIKTGRCFIYNGNVIEDTFNRSGWFKYQNGLENAIKYFDELKEKKLKAEKEIDELIEKIEGMKSIKSRLVRGDYGEKILRFYYKGSKLKDVSMTYRNLDAVISDLKEILEQLEV
jgi:hypothetical protein